MTSVGTLTHADPSLLTQPVDLPRAPGLMLPALSLCKRELVRFLRQRHRVIGALGPPLMFWVVFGAGVGRSFHVGEVAGGSSNNYLQYFFPGTLLMIVLFTAIFSTISIIEDRREGFLQSVLVAPVSRMAIVLGKVLGGTVLAFGQGLVFLPLGLLAGMHLTVLGFLTACATLFIVAFSLTALSFCIAWRMTSTQGFHAIMNLFLVPLWILSGAMFPPQNAWVGMRWLMRLDPLTYGLAGIRRSMYFGRSADLSALPSWGVITVASVGFAVFMFLMASWIASGRTKADLQ